MPDVSLDSITSRAKVETSTQPPLKEGYQAYTSHTASHLYTPIGNKTIEVNLIYNYGLFARLTGCEFASTIIV